MAVDYTLALPQVVNGNWTTRNVSQYATNYPTTAPRTYLYANLTGGLSSDAIARDEIPEVRFVPDLPAGGNYSVWIYTPGCLSDGGGRRSDPTACAARHLVNITMSMTENAPPIATSIYQITDELRLDQIYAGNVDAATSNFTPTVLLRPGNMASIMGGAGPLSVVAQAVRFTLASNDDEMADVSRVSTAGKAGIAIGVAVLATLVILIAALLCTRRRRRRRRILQLSISKPPLAEHSWEGKPELSGEGYSVLKSDGEVHEAAEGEIKELGGTVPVYELEAPNAVHEMGSQREAEPTHTSKRRFSWD